MLHLNRRYGILGILSVCFLSSSLIAQKASDVSQLFQNTKAPDYSAFSILGVDANNVMNAGTIKGFGLSANFNEGELLPNLAVSIAPFRKSYYDSIGAYQNDKLKSIEISAGIVREKASAGDTVQAAVGIGWVLIDPSEPSENPEVKAGLDSIYSDQGERKLSDRKFKLKNDFARYLLSEHVVPSLTNYLVGTIMTKLDSLNCRVCTTPRALLDTIISLSKKEGFKPQDSVSFSNNVSSYLDSLECIAMEINGREIFLSKKRQDLFNKFDKSWWNGELLQFLLAGKTLTPNAEIGKFQLPYVSFVANYAHPGLGFECLKEYLRLAAQVEYDAPTIKTLSLPNSLYSSGILCTYGLTSLDFSAEWLFRHKTDNSLERLVAGGIEFKIGDKYWLAFGANYDYVNKSTTSKVNFKWAIPTQTTIKF